MRVRGSPIEGRQAGSCGAWLSMCLRGVRLRCQAWPGAIAWVCAQSRRRMRALPRRVLVAGLLTPVWRALGGCRCSLAARPVASPRGVRPGVRPNAGHDRLLPIRRLGSGACWASRRQRSGEAKAAVGSVASLGVASGMSGGAVDRRQAAQRRGARWSPTKMCEGLDVGGWMGVGVELGRLRVRIRLPERGESTGSKVSEALRRLRSLCDTHDATPNSM